MAELKCKDGTVIKISDETEAELRKAFEPKPPSYHDDWLKIRVRDNRTWPICISVHGEEVTRSVRDTKSYIEALQVAVEYCNNII